MTALTIGMAAYDDFDGVYFTLQALRLHQDLDDVELLVVDNYGCEATKHFVESWAQGRYVLAPDAVGTAAPRERVFREAAGAAVLCCDAHVLFAPGAIARLKQHYAAQPDTIDLLQGPLLYDDLATVATHFEPVWRAQMWGVWATDPRGIAPEGAPFEIPMQGLGVFSCRKAAWPGFHPAFRGFGGEEGYLHEKVRQAGGRCLCLPWLRWAHRFGRPRGVPYPLTVEDKLRNYVIGHFELGLDLTPVLIHFADYLPNERVLEIAAEAVREVWGVSLPVSFSTPEPAPEADGPPLISCICMTYNRAPTHLMLLEEAVESFLRQTYPNKELIVFNDTPGQTIACDAPGVRVVNLPERFATLGAKVEASVRAARGTLIAPWDDDDISLPWRLAVSVEQLGDADYFNPRRYWFMTPSELRHDRSTGYAFNASLFRRSAMDAVSGLAEIDSGYDALMDGLFRTRLDRVADPLRGTPPLPLGKWYYIYRWGVSPTHVSGGNPESYYREIGAMPVETGEFRLCPHWRRDYVAETRALLPG